MAAGDEARVLDRPAGRVTVAGSMLAYYGDQEIMRRLLEVEGETGSGTRSAGLS